MGIFGQRRKIAFVLDEKEKESCTFHCRGLDGREVVQKVHDGIRELQTALPSEKLSIKVDFDDDLIDPQMLMMNIMMNINGIGPGYWSEGQPLKFSVEG